MANVFIVDSISSLFTSNSRLISPLTLIKIFDVWQKKYNLTIIVITGALPPSSFKKRVMKLNSLAMSKAAISLASSVIGISKSNRKKNEVYLKQFKSSNDVNEFTEENVMLLELKNENTTLRFKYLANCNENLLL